METKVIEYRQGPIVMKISVAPEDEVWVRALFARNAKPFCALRDMGFDSVDRKELDA